MAKMTKARIFRELGLKSRMPGANCGGEWFADSKDYITSVNPTTGEVLARIEQASAKDYDKVMKQAKKAFLAWRELPAPKRGEVVRQVGQALRDQVGHAEDQDRAQGHHLRRL